MVAAVQIAGDATTASGTYVLRIRLARGVDVAFGRFRGGARQHLPPGEMVYVGSAMGANGAPTLARRLLRHASRSGENPPHALRPALLAAMGGDATWLPRSKTPRWHVDYVLNLPEADLTHVIAIRSGVRHEDEIALGLAARDDTRVLLPGLGASDAPGRTHLLAFTGGDNGWAGIWSLVAGLQ